MLVSEINDLVNAVDDNKKNVVTSEAGDTCRFSDILLSSGYRRDKTDAMRSSSPPS